jgi:endonuclease I
MKSKYIVIALCTLFAIQLKAQKLRVSSDTVKYGTLFKYVTSSVNVTIYNDAPFDIQGAKLKTTNIDFTVSDSVIDIPSMSSKQVKVTFRPRHNVDYNDELIVATNSPYGAQSIHLKGTGYYTNSYYNTTQNLWDANLLAALKAKIQNATTLGYTNVRDQMYGYVDNFDDSVTCVYTGRTEQFNTRTGANTFNFTAEHTFPQSKFGSVDPMQSDVHHLFPADGSANTRRSNDPFGIVTSPTWMEGGSLTDNSHFEPRDYHKGTAARALFYMVTRYQDFTGFFNPQEDLLREWALKFWPNQKDSIRHARAAQVQGNRNPFTDHPEFIERISNFAGPAPALVKKLQLTYTNPVHLGYVALHDTIYHNIIAVNTGTDVLNVNLNALNAKPQPNVTTPTNAFTLQPKEARRVTFMFVGRAPGANFTDSFAMQVSGLTVPVIAFTANVSGLSVGDAARTNISLYPNPAAATVTLNADRTLNYPATVGFYDVAGRLIHSTVLNESFTDINIASLPAGCYFVQVNDGTLSSVTKLVKY